MKNIKRTFLTLCLLLLGYALYPQTEIQYTEPYKKLFELRTLKVKYESTLNSEKNDTRRLGSYKAYKRAVAEIKSKPDIYLTFIDNALLYHREHLEKVAIPYNYYHKGLSNHDPNIKQSGYNYFKIIKYSLFETGMDELADLRDVPFIKIKEWRRPTYEDLELYRRTPAPLP